METDTIRGALDRLKEWGETLQHHGTRTVIAGQWAGHEEFFADLGVVEGTLRERTEMLSEYINAPAVVFEDERVSYIAIQVDRGLRNDARALLAPEKES